MRHHDEKLMATPSQRQSPFPTRRQFLKTTVGAAAAVAGSAIASRANNHPHPSPQSLTYLDPQMYIRNMAVIAHFQPGEDRGGKMQRMSVGDRRYLVQQGDFIDVSDLRKPDMYNHHEWNGYQVQVAWNQKLKKWILVDRK